MKKTLSIGAVILAALLLYPKFPKSVLTIFALLVVTALIINWDKIKKNFQ